MQASSIILTLLILAFGASAETIPNPSKRKGSGPLFRIHRHEKWGYMDRTGKVVIQPQFDEAHDFFHSRAGVRIGQKWAYIDEAGKIVIPPSFDDVRDFLEELAPVRIGRKWGYIDTSGRMKIEPRFQAAAEFHEGLARVHLWEKVLAGSRQYTNADAPSWAFRLQEDDHFDMPCCFAHGGHFGFIDKAGAFVIPPAYFIAQDFSEGLAAVRVEESITSKFGYIDRSGAFVISPRFNQAAPFSEGLAAVEETAHTVGNQSKDIAFGFIDKNGGYAIPGQYQFAGNFSEGLALVQTSSDGMGFIDHSGKFVIGPGYDGLRDFSEGVAVACVGGCNYIDSKGRPIIKNVRASWPFVDGLAVVGLMAPQIYIDRQGHKIADY